MCTMISTFRGIRTRLEFKVPPRLRLKRINEFLMCSTPLNVVYHCPHPFRWAYCCPSLHRMQQRTTALVGIFCCVLHNFWKDEYKFRGEKAFKWKIEINCRKREGRSCKPKIFQAVDFWLQGAPIISLFDEAMRLDLLFSKKELLIIHIFQITLNKCVHLAINLILTASDVVIKSLQWLSLCCSCFKLELRQDGIRGFCLTVYKLCFVLRELVIVTRSKYWHF